MFGYFLTVFRNLSLILCLILIGIYIRSYWFASAVSWRSTSPLPTQVKYQHAILGACEGGVSFFWLSGVTTASDVEEMVRYHPLPLEGISYRIGEHERTARYFEKPTSPHPLGFQAGAYFLSHSPYRSSSWFLCIPFWFLVMLFAVLPGAMGGRMLVKWRSAKKERQRKIKGDGTVDENVA